MPMPAFPSLHIRPFFGGSDVKTSETSATTTPFGIAKRMKTFEASSMERNLTSGAVKGNTMKTNVFSSIEKMPGKLENIHSKLFAEAEKIQKWKTSIEHQHEQKEKKLQDSYQIIDSQRTELLDLQLQNETLRMQLADELQNRNDILQKQQSTRELCVALKKHFIGLQAKIDNVNRIKEQFEIVVDKKEQHYQDLVEKFNGLQLNHMEQMQTLTNIVSTREREMNAMRDAYNNQLAEANKQLEYLSDIKESNERDIMKLCSELKEKDTFCSNISSEKEQLLMQVSSLKEGHTRLAFQVKEANDHLCKVQSEKSELELQYSSCEKHLSELQAMNGELKDHFQMCRKQYEEKLSSLEASLKDAKRELSDKKLSIAQNQTVIADLENLVKSLSHNQETLEQQIEELNKDVLDGIELQKKINELEENLKTVLEEKDNLTTDIEHIKLLLSDKESICDTLHTEIDAEKKIISDLRVENDELQFQIKTVSVEKKMKVDELEEKLQCVLKEKDSLTKDFEETKLLLSKKESLCKSLSAELADKEKDVSNLASQNEKLQVSLTEEQRLRNDLSIAEERCLELNKKKDDLEKKLSEKEVGFADGIAENDKKIKKLQANLKMKEKTIKELENQLSKLDCALSDEQRKAQSFVSTVKEEECKVKDLQSKIELKQKAEDELKEENCSLRNSLSEEEKKWKSISIALEEEKHKSTVLKEDITIKDSNIMLLESKNATLEEQINDLVREKKELKETHMSQLSEMLTQSRKSQELITLNEKSLKDYRKDSIEKERQLQDLRSKIQKLENQLRFGSNKGDLEHLKSENARLKALVEKSKAELLRKGDLENLKSENARLKPLVEKLKAELLKKDDIESLKTENVQFKALMEKSKVDLQQAKVQNVYAQSRRTTGRPVLQFKPVEDPDSSASDTVEIVQLQNFDNCARPAKINLPQKRDGTGRQSNPPAASVAPCHRVMPKPPVPHSSESGNKKLRLMMAVSKTPGMDAPDQQNSEKTGKGNQTRKFFKSTRSPTRKEKTGLRWFEMDSTYGFLE